MFCADDGVETVDDVVLVSEENSGVVGPRMLVDAVAVVLGVAGGVLAGLASLLAGVCRRVALSVRSRFWRLVVDSLWDRVCLEARAEL